MSDRSPDHLSPASVPFHPLRTRATGWLLTATVLWGLSFPLAKALAIAQRAFLPGADSWFLASLPLVFRFGVAALVLAVVSLRTLHLLTASEARQGIGLGVFSAGGMLLQMDGLSYTAASTSAFLTSCYCVLIPVIVALQRRRWPPLLVTASSGLVVLGMAILAGVDWHTLHLGRGELETILASFFFAGQIFWLERPDFARNRTGHATLLMFATIAAAATPVMLARCRVLHDIVVGTTASVPILGFLLALTLLCTLATFTLMNHWQKYLEATEAGLIYCAEPVSASLCALCLPAWLGTLASVNYPDESPTLRLLFGGLLITAANVCIQLKPRAVTPVN